MDFLLCEEDHATEVSARARIIIVARRDMRELSVRLAAEQFAVLYTTINR
jgi:hypothetical protein